MIWCNWLILWQNALYLYLGRLRMCLTTSRNHVSRSNVEAFKSIQEIKQGVQNHSSSTAGRYLLDTSYLSRFKNFRFQLWFSWDPWICLWAFFSPNPRHIKGLFQEPSNGTQVAQALSKLCSSKLWPETKFMT